MSKRLPIPFHPILFALFAVLALAVHNESQNPLQEAGGPLLAALVFAGLSWAGLNALLRHPRKSALAASVFLLLFFSFGQFLYALRALADALGILKSVDPFLESTPALLIWLAVWTTLFVAVLFLATRSTSELGVHTQFLNATAVALTLIVVCNGLLGFGANARGSEYIAAWRRSATTAKPSSPPAVSPRRPNIYYIILDGYGRGDILGKYYHLDNSGFYSFLADRGFYVADQSHSNYMQTALSLASSLNSTYLEKVADAVGEDYPSRLPLLAMIDDSLTFRELRSYGYQVVTFSTGFPYTELPDADIHWGPPWDVNSFDNALIGTTPLPLLLRLPPLESQYDLHRDQVLFSLDHLADAARLASPCFVFVHIIAPHPPFVFGADGQAIDPDRWFDYSDGSQLTSRTDPQDYVENYRNQLVFVTKKMEGTVDQVLADSSVPPIIVIQSDHGPGSMLDWSSAQNTNIPERLSILNAYYLPGQDYHALYAGITPVNTFGLILNRLFGTEYHAQADRSYYSTYDKPYQFIDVTDRLSPGR